MSTQWQAAPSPRPSRPRPPLTKRLRLVHWIALDSAAALLCAVFMAFDLRSAVSASGWWTGDLWCLLGGLVLSVPVALRRRAPLAAFAAAVALPVVATVLVVVVSHVLPQTYTGNGVPWQDAPVFLLPAVYVIHLVAAQYRRRTAVLALAVVLVALGFCGVQEGIGSTGEGSAIFVAFAVIVSWMVGYSAGQRRAYSAALQEHAASSAVTEERLRIARELHDVVAHSMTVIAVQAGYGKHVIGAQPAQAEEALGAIQSTSREALAEMRRMLGVLRQSGPAPYGKTKESGVDATVASAPDVLTASGDDSSGETPAAPLTPVPGLADLGRLAGRIANAGVKVELEVRGERPEVPPGIDLAAFRIVQEALTNVVKHSGAPRCNVTVSYLEDALSIEITDEGRGSPVPATVGGEEGAELAGGHGLIGMRERVSLYGGLLAAGPRPERGFQVSARLPLRDGAR